MPLSPPRITPPAEQPAIIVQQPQETTIGQTPAPLQPVSASSSNTQALPLVSRPGRGGNILFLPSVQRPIAPATLPVTGLWLDPRLPSGLRAALISSPDLALTPAPEGAALALAPGGERPITSWTYAVAAPFSTIDDETSVDQVIRLWRGEGRGILLVDESTLYVFTELWGAPSPETVQLTASENLVQAAWKTNAWALLPFEALEARWKTLTVDGQSPLRKDFDLGAYPLSVPFSLYGNPPVVDAVLAAHAPGSPDALLPASNRDPARLTTVAMTGVTALVRATAFTMEQRGVNYPGKDVAELLRSADITHVSNEVPFAEDCPAPNPMQEGMIFCSDPRYIGLLEDIGTDVVELTGDHFKDWGTGAMLYTLDLYRERGWGTYGGGASLGEARQAYLIEHNGNRLAFIGCNGKGAGFAGAGKKQPGAAPCAMDWLEKEIRRLREEGYLPIVTFQHLEEYSYKPSERMQRDFQAAAEAGALVISGSQAHQPQAFEFRGDALVHYGLGNLFFDQFDVSQACRQAFIDRHVFYNGRYIGAELETLLFVDYARPRFMTEAERQDLLQTIFKASGW